MVEEDVAYVQRENGRGISDIFGAGGSILTTVMVLNARCLLEATGRKFNEFCSLVKKTEPKPDVIVVHEVNGYSGEMNIRGKIEGALRIYGVVFSQRLKQHAVARAGGGIMCLFKKKLFRAMTVRPPEGLDTMLLDGYVRTFCLLQQCPGVLPLIVMVAYIPPPKKGNKEVRKQGLNAIPEMMEHVRRIWPGSKRIVVAHVNAPDGCQMLRTKLEGVVPARHVAALPLWSERPVFTGQSGMLFSRMPNGSVVHQRMKVRSVNAATAQGKRFYSEMARKGMLPTMGVSEKIRPSTWRVCARCVGGCRCGRGKMTGQNDVVFVDQETLFFGLKSGLTTSLRKVAWSKAIDHAVVKVTIPLVDAAVHSSPRVQRKRSAVRRLRLPAKLLVRAKLLRMIGLQHDQALQGDVLLTAGDGWRKVAGRFDEPAVSVEEMTSEELSAALKNAPRAFWEHQEYFEKDAGDIEVVSSASLLDCICNPDGSLLVGDSRETAGFIVRHRQEMAEVPLELVCGDEVVFEALRSLSKFNSTIGGLSEESAAHKVAVRPNCYWDRIEERRKAMGRPAGRGFEEWLGRTPNWVDEVARSYSDVKRKYADECGKLNADITMAEISSMLNKMNDAGASLDNVPPVVMKSHANHVECALIKILQTQFNMVFSTGVVPGDWQRHRMLLLHKGHGAHPSVLDSYRAIGIGCCELKMMSLIMEERLNLFLTETKSLTFNQLGFKRKSGTREASLALAEIIRNAAGSESVLTAFVDVRAAYDSVIREVLYTKMLKMGIGGRFLTTIQGFYHSMEASLEVGGAVIGEVRMELGLAQGSPLSPILFNIYINSCISELERLAYVKAAESGGVPYGLCVPSAVGDAIGNDRLVSLWFADDSAVVETDLVRLQWLMDTLSMLLKGIGLTINIRKTKLMVTMWQGAKCGPSLDGPLKVYGTPVETVSKFPHLGMMLNSRGNWKDAWTGVYVKASLAYHNAVAGGLFFHAGSLAGMTIFARAKIWSYLDSVMAIAGAGGAVSSAFCRVADACIGSVLRSIGGYAAFNPEALRIESGVWDTRTRTDMLVMRFFTKICSADHDSLVWRVVKMSMRTTEAVYENPQVKWAAADKVHRQSWTQQVLAAAVRLGISKSDVRNMTPGVLLVLQEERLVDGGVVWEEVVSPVDFIPTWVHKVRLLIRGLPEGYTFVIDKDFWMVRKEHVGEGPILRQLSERLRLANFAALRRKANICRRALVKEFVLKQIASNSNLRGWASITGYSSFMQSYWHISNVKDARSMLRIRLHVACNEEAQRRRPIMTKQCGEVQGRCIDRIDERNRRACYLCEAVQGQQGIFMVESLHHMLITCPNVGMEALRVKLKADLGMLGATEDGLRDHPVPEMSQSVMWAIMLLCTTSESLPVHLRQSARLRETMSAMGRRDELPVIDRGGVQEAVRWLSPLVSEWMDRLREYHNVGDTAAMPGAKVVAMVCAHMRRVFTEHRKALKNNIEYCLRSRDSVGLAGL